MQITLQERIAQLVAHHGSFRAVGRVLKIDASYLTRLFKGEKADPSLAVLRKLRLTRVITYQLKEPL